MEVAISITGRCNATCLHCTVDSGPRVSTALSFEQISKLMADASADNRRKLPLRFGFSGGEPFLNLSLLEKILAFGRSLSAEMGCVTNAFWGSSDRRAAEVIERVKAAGMSSLAISTSQWHQLQIPLSRVTRVVQAARYAGIQTQLKLAYSSVDLAEGRIDQWASEVGADHVQPIPVSGHVRTGQALQPEEYVSGVGVPSGTCPASVITVREDGGAFACCTPGAFTSRLSIGNVLTDAFRTVHARFRFEPLLNLLRRQGPSAIAERAVERGLGHRLRSGYADVCDLCAHVTSDPELSILADECAAEETAAWASRLGFKPRSSAVP